MSKFALLIGINYYNTPNQLYGCINDVIMMRKYLMEKRGYLNENILVLRDDSQTFIKPTRENIIKELINLITKANTNKSSEIFFHYSGHGTYARDTNGDEADRRDEYICPVDLKCISDDEIRNLLSGLNNNTKMYSIMDCCHSGTNLDLPYLYTQINGKLLLLQDNSKKYANLLNKNIISISGCRDDQYSADAYNVYSVMPNNDTNYSITTNRSGGALTSCLLNILNTNIQIENSLILLHNNMRRKYSQIPQISSCKNLIVKQKKNKKSKKITTHMLLKIKNIKKIVNKK